MDSQKLKICFKQVLRQGSPELVEGQLLRVHQLLLRQLNISIVIPAKAGIQECGCPAQAFWHDLFHRRVNNEKITGCVQAAIEFSRDVRL